jgi:Asp-tRNA(Asn)/Glu-tRNA(Gln) amidotransferase B subunit
MVLVLWEREDLNKKAEIAKSRTRKRWLKIRNARAGFQAVKKTLMGQVMKKTRRAVKPWEWPNALKPAE